MTGTSAAASTATASDSSATTAGSGSATGSGSASSQTATSGATTSTATTGSAGACFAAMLSIAFSSACSIVPANLSAKLSVTEAEYLLLGTSETTCTFPTPADPSLSANSCISGSTSPFFFFFMNLGFLGILNLGA